MGTALIVVDTQPTFCEGGGLPVAGGNAVAAKIGAYLVGHRDDYELVVASQDWHIDPGDHWAPDGEAPDFQMTWPRHGIAGSPEAELHPAMLAALDADPRGRAIIDAVVRKGMFDAAYSAFEGRVVEGEPVMGDLGEPVPLGPGLASYLRARGVTRVDVVGIATDHCDRMTALDAVAEGFEVRLLTDLCVGVAPDTTAAALDELAAAGVEITTSTAVAEGPR